MIRSFAGSVAVIAGTGCALGAGEPVEGIRVVPTRSAGVLYVNMATGERTLTLFDRAGAVPPVQRSAFLFEWWMSVDENPCVDGPVPGDSDSFGINADSTSDVANGITEPVAMFDFGDLPFDSIITGVQIKTATLKTETTDSNGDGILDTGYDVAMVFYDAASEENASSVRPPTAVVRVESIPGDRGDVPQGFSSYELIVDFGAGKHFELGDSDGLDLGDLWLPGALGGLDVSTVTTSTTMVDGLADFQYLQYYTQHASHAKVIDASTFIGVGTPVGSVSFEDRQTTTQTTSTGITVTVTVTVTDTVFTPDPLPQAQGVADGFGLATLGTGGDVGAIDWIRHPDWMVFFGGLDCSGYRDGGEPGPFEDGFTPFAQLAVGLLGNDPGAACGSIDFNADGILDFGDISAFLALAQTQDLGADLNGDGIVDSGDIAEFVGLFLACTG